MDLTKFNLPDTIDDKTCNIRACSQPVPSPDSWFVFRAPNDLKVRVFACTEHHAVAASGKYRVKLDNDHKINLEPILNEELRQAGFQPN